MEKKKILFLVCLLIVIGLIIGLYFLKDCSKSEDCVKVRTTYCSCAMGGEEACVPKSEVGKYEDMLKDCPENVFCSAMYNCYIGECECESGKCKGVIIDEKD